MMESEREKESRICVMWKGDEADERARIASR